MLDRKVLLSSDIFHGYKSSKFSKNLNYPIKLLLLMLGAYNLGIFWSFQYGIIEKLSYSS